MKGQFINTYLVIYTRINTKDKTMNFNNLKIFTLNFLKIPDI